MVRAYRALRSRVNSTKPPSLCRNCQFRNSLNTFEDGTALRSHLCARPSLDELTQPLAAP